MAVYHLHKWSVNGAGDPFTAPERSHKRLVGYRDDEDRQVITGPIVAIQGRNITTLSGSVYILEDIDPEYLQWMTEHGYVLNSENPIADKRKS